jgi:hypothetical protein
VRALSAAPVVFSLVAQHIVAPSEVRSTIIGGEVAFNRTSSRYLSGSRHSSSSNLSDVELIITMDNKTTPLEIGWELEVEVKKNRIESESLRDF